MYNSQSKHPEVRRFNRCHFIPLRYYHRLEADVEELPSSYRVGSILFETDDLRLALKEECKAWKRAFGGALNDKAGAEQDEIFNFIESMSKRMRCVCLI